MKSNFEKTDAEYIASMQSYMLKNNIDQEELARRLGVTAAAVGKWLMGHNGITPRNKAKIELLTEEKNITENGSRENLEKFAEAMCADAKAIAEIGRKWGHSGEVVLRMAGTLLDNYLAAEDFHRAKESGLSQREMLDTLAPRPDLLASLLGR